MKNAELAKARKQFMDVKKERAPSYFRDVLEGLGDAIEVIIDPYSAPSPFRSGVPRWVYEENDRLFQQRRRYKALHHLQRKKYVEMKKRGNDVLWRFTSDGAAKALRYRIENCSTNIHQWYYIFFDIPEAARDLRDEFRNLLKKSGFVFIQRSVWATNKDVKNDLMLLCQITGIEPWVKFTSSDIAPEPV